MTYDDICNAVAAIALAVIVAKMLRQAADEMEQRQHKPSSGDKMDVAQPQDEGSPHHDKTLKRWDEQ